MNTHLEDDEITLAVAGLELAPAAEGHLSSCLSCRRRVEAVRELIDERRRLLAADAPDWQRQRQEILLRLPPAALDRPHRGRHWLRPLLAAAAVLLVAIGVRILWAPAPPAPPPAAAELPVEEILAEVNAILDDESLPGFESIDPGVDDPGSLFENGES